MRRIFIVILATAALVLGLQTYAQASITKSDCKILLQDEAATDRVCMVWKYHAMAGAPGISVDRGTISFDGGDMQSVDCYWIKIVNANGVTTWIKQGGECDLPSSPGDRTFVPIQDMPQSVYATVSWSGHARIAGAPDQDFVFSMKLTQ